jgi:hypothetical protein
MNEINQMKPFWSVVHSEWLRPEDVIMGLRPMDAEAWV